MLAGGHWLTVQQIVTELRMEGTRLAALGACLSGRLGLRRGEEHVGLVQAMMTAGTNSVVASLWRVNDAATRALFEAFYAGYATGQSPAAAMKEAGRVVRGYPDWSHPYYWAAFQISGLAHLPPGSHAGAVGPNVQHRADALYQQPAETRRGGVVMRVEDLERSSVILLKVLRDRAASVVARLAPGERERLRAGLAALAERASNVRTPADEFVLVDEVHRLVEDIPPLWELLLAPGYDVEAQRRARSGIAPDAGTRWVTDEDADDAARQPTTPQDSAASIRNRVEGAGQKIAEAMARDKASVDEHGR